MIKPRIRILSNGSIQIKFDFLDYECRWQSILTSYAQSITGEKDRFVILPQLPPAHVKKCANYYIDHSIFA